MKNKLVKKILVVALAAAVMTTTPAVAPTVVTYAAATPTDGNATQPASKGEEVKDTTSKADYTVNSNKGTVTYDGSTSESTNVKVPATITVDGVTYKVTVVEDGAFKGDTDLKKVTIGKNITEIGDGAFSGCTALKEVKLGAKVKEIGDNAFKGCTSLKKVELPKTTTTLGANVFKGCKNLKTITITSTKLTSKTVDDKAFKDVPAGTTIKVPASKLKAYKQLFAKKGLSSKVKIVKA